MIPAWAQVAMAVAIPAGLVAAVPRRWLTRTMVLWLLSPLFAYLAVVVWELLTRPPVENPLGKALLGFMLISALTAILWVILCGAGFLVGFSIRRQLSARPDPAPSAAPALASAATPTARDHGHARPRTPIEAALRRFAESAALRPTVAPSPFAEWRAAMVVAAVAAVLIVVATILSLQFAPARGPKAPPATVPTFRP